jgi:hypothetical protein
MTSTTDRLLDQMEKFKSDFLQCEGKNNFFKKSQKLDCAKKMSQTFNLQDMIQKTVFIIPGTNKITFDYTVFKLYACPDNYNEIIDYIIRLYDCLLLQYSAFEANIILDSFTISAAERYKGVIQLFCSKCMNTQTKYSNLTEKINIYYTPSMMESISTLLKPFIDKELGERIVLFSKAESPERIKQLYIPVSMNNN